MKILRFSYQTALYFMAFFAVTSTAQGSKSIKGVAANKSEH